MEDAIPDDMSYTINPFDVNVYTIKFDNVWDSDTLYQGSSTFIPTASAMDLQCNGDLPHSQGHRLAIPSAPEQGTDRERRENPCGQHRPALDARLCSCTAMRTAIRR